MTHKNPNSPTSLTEFAPHSADVRQSSGLFSRIFRRNDSSIREDLDHILNEENPISEDPTEPDRSVADTLRNEYLNGKSELQSSSAMAPGGIAMEPSARTLPSVLRRLRSIIAGSSQTPQRYKNSDFKQYWMPDRNCHECYECNCRFHAFRRRHHCRICGQIFCSQCCNKEVPGKIMGFTDSLRVCTYCYEVVLQYAENLNGTGDDIEEISVRPDLQWSRESSESPSRLIPGQTDGMVSNLSFSGLNPRIGKSHRLSSIFDEDLKCSSSSADINSSVCDFNVYCDEQRLTAPQDPVQLHNLWLLMTNSTEGIAAATHNSRVRSYSTCMLGRHIVDWLLDKDKVMSRDQAVSLGQLLLETKWLESTSINDPIFRDDLTSYRPAEMALRGGVADVPAHCSTFESDGDDEPQWFKEIKQNDKDDTASELSAELSKIPSTVSAPRDDNVDAPRNSVFFVDTQVPKDLQEPLESSPCAIVEAVVENSENKEVTEPFLAGASFGLSLGSGMSGAFQDTIDQIPGDNPSGAQEGTEHSNEAQSTDSYGTHYRNQLSKIQNEHLKMLVMQMLNKSGLSSKWSDTILNTAMKVGQMVRPEVCLQREGNEMDIRQYVRIKKVPGGTKSNTCIINGIVCTKNVAHKKMRQQMTNPRVLLLRAPIEYQRVENKFSSLEPQILQENEFLKNCVSRIAKLQPDILLVEKTVSRLAQGFLLDAGITLVLNVKASVMERVARMTQAVIATSIDGLVAKTTMGLCRKFYLQTFTLLDGASKTLMYFDGCNSHLGCTITLRGGSLNELQRVKQILSFLVYASYHSGLELEFLMNELAIPPQLKSDQSMEDIASNDVDDIQNSAFSQNCRETMYDHVDENDLDENCDSLFPGHSGQDSVFEKDLGNDSEQSVKFDIMNEWDRCQHSLSLESPVNLETVIDCFYENGSNDASVSVIPSEDSAHEKYENQRTESNSENIVPLEQNVGPGRNKKESMTSELVTDLSDPLHSYQILKDEKIFDYSSAPLLKEDKRHTCQQFKKALSEVLLTISPFVKFDMPYLETEAGSMCKLRSCFPSEIFWSELFHPERSSQINGRQKLSATESALTTSTSLPSFKLLPKHPFITDRLSLPVTDLQIQAELADFRARGGRIPFEQAQNGCSRDGSPVTSVCSQSKVQSESERESKNPLECLSPYQHQRLCLLFSSFSTQSINYPHHCVSPWIVTMNFYSRTDITLGGFLEKYCFSETYRCVNRHCDTPMIDHVRRFVHGSGCIQVALKKLDAQLFYPAEAMYVWNWCRKCKRVSPKILLSPETYQMSFAKYLEQRFHGNRYLRRSNGSCRHSLHHDHLQYFGNQQIIASFKYSALTLKEVAFPPIVVSILPPKFTLQQLEDEGKMLNFRTSSVFNLILEQLIRLKKEAFTESQSAYVTELVIEVEKEKDSIIQKIEYVQSLITDAKRMDKQGQADYNLGVQVLDAFVNIKRQVAEVVTAWNERIHETESQQKKLDRSRLQISSGSSASIVNKSKDVTNSVNTSNPIVSDNFSAQLDDGAVVITMNPSLDEEREENSDLKTGASGPAIDLNATPGSASPCVASDNSSVFSSPPIPVKANEVDASIHDGLPDVLVTTCLGQAVELSAGSLESSSPPKLGFSDLVNPVTSASQLTTNFSQPRSRSSSDLRKIKVVSKDGTMQEIEKKDRTMKQIFSSLLSGFGNNTVPIPFPSDEHHLLSLSCQKVPVVVYDHEPSSIIAFALSSYEYEKQLQELRINQMLSANDSNSLKRVSRSGDNQMDADVKRGVVSFLKSNTLREKSPSRSSGKFQVEAVVYIPNSDRDSLEDADEIDGFQTIPDSSQKPVNKSNKQLPQNFHIELQFSDCAAKFYCRICYAEQFAKLRKLIFPEGEERYIRSLSRCFTWLASGGKSGSSFCKAQDDRFILKQMSKIEVQDFNEFAPHYFQYVAKAYEEPGKPIAIAKILGVYRIGYQNSKTTTSLKQDLLVMENLFYGRKISQIFDLKGSVRNRFVDTSGKRVEDVVLLDENLVKASIESPMYIFPHSKAVLMDSISRDTEFLATHSVMDYSLLVGVDDSEKQFVVGIIDYMRTYTWDKKVEMLVKTAYGKEAPTVLQPEAYRRRFVEAMDKYFHLVPDRWHGLGQGIA